MRLADDCIRVICDRVRLYSYFTKFEVLNHTMNAHPSKIGAEKI